MSNEKPPFEHFDRATFEALTQGPDGRQKVEAYMETVLAHFKNKIKASLAPFQPKIEPTIPVDLSELVPTPRSREIPIWENMDEKKTPAPPQATPKAPVVHVYPEMPKVRPTPERVTIVQPQVVQANKGTVVSEQAKVPVTDTFAAKPPKDEPTPTKEPVDKTPKGKKVNTDAIEKRYKDREEKLGDLFKNRGQIS